ncbi:MAG: hypothetical protein IJB73_02540 [Firmicutes bacterium]|nr:hypothetical protein [Bacillota bacterium]
MKRRTLIVCILILSLVLGETCFAFAATSSSDKPKAPTMNSAVLADDGSVDVVWSKVSGADKYEIYRATSKSGKYTKIATVSSNNRIYNDADVEDYKNYYYKLKAVDDGKKSAYSKVVSAYVEGDKIDNRNIQLSIQFENGEKITMRAGDGTSTTACPLNCTLKYNGKITDDYKIFYDKENVTIKKGTNGRIQIKPKTAGYYLFTFAIGEEKGTFSYNAELSEYSDLTFTWKQGEAEQDSMSVKIPELKESVLTIKYKGKVIKDFKVTTSNKNVCTVKKNGSKVTVTNKAPGKCNITVSYKGQKTVFKWIVKDGSATEPYNFVDGVPVSNSLPKEQAKTAIGKLADAQYSKKEIKEMVKADLTLEEAADKISTAQDAVNYLFERGYHSDYSYNPYMEYNGYGWGWNLSADFTYEHNAGVCGGISNLMNRLLKGDYDSQGYVQVDGHVYNYFYNDGVYFYCDFANLQQFNFRNYKNGTTYSVPAYMLFVTDNPGEYGKYSIKIRPDYKNPYSDDYMPYIYSYPLDGENLLPRGDSEAHETADGIVHLMTLPDAMEDTVEFIYLAEDRKIRFMKAPTPDMYPPEVNIPKD